MPVARNMLIWIAGYLSLMLLTAHPAVSEVSMSERSLPSDTVIEETFQAGSGLPVGKIQTVRGEPLIYHRDPSVGYRARAGLPLYQGDTLHTRKNSRILFRLVDGSRLTMAPGTRLTLVQAKSNSARKSSVSILSLKQGGVRFVVNPSSELAEFKFEVRTETAFVQARAADFIVITDPAATEVMAIESSRLEVTSLAEPEEIYFLSDYQRTVVRRESVAPVVDTVSPMDTEARMAEFRLVPANKIVVSRSTDLPSEDIVEEALED